MLAYLKAFVAYLKAYVFSKCSGWQSMKYMTVSSMECVSGSVTQRQRSHQEHLITAQRLDEVNDEACKALHEVRCAQDAGLVNQVSTQE
jgi:hypothetical protein